MKETQKSKVNIKNVVQTSFAPLILMVYGWYLGQLHQSGPDIAGILMFITGAAGLILAFILRAFTKKYSWHNQWYSNVAMGIIGCGIVFAFMILYARWHG